MASGRTHDLINLVAFPPIVYYLKPDNFWAFTAGYLVGTFFLTPDNDLYHSHPNKRWKFLRFIWKPYVILFSHRGISHMPIFGILTKLIYLAVVFLVFYFFLSISLHFVYPEGEKILYKNFSETGSNIQNIIKNPFVISFLVGLFLSEIVHIITDILYSNMKKLKLIR